MDEQIERSGLEEAATVLAPPTRVQLIDRVSSLTAGETIILDNASTITARAEGGYLVCWPAGQLFRANEAEGAVDDALGYRPVRSLIANGSTESQGQIFARACAQRLDAWLPACPSHTKS